MTTQKFAFHDILMRVIASGRDRITPVEGSELTLCIELDNVLSVFEYLFKFKPVDPGPVIHVSSAPTSEYLDSILFRFFLVTKLNQAMSGLGFHYLVLLEDGAIKFEQRLTRAPYPQEIPVDPIVSFATSVGSTPLSLSETILHLAEISCTVFPDDGVGKYFPRLLLVKLIEQFKSTLLRGIQRSLFVYTFKILEPFWSRAQKLYPAGIGCSTVWMHPIAKTLTVGMGQIYANLVELDDWDDRLLEIIEEMTVVLTYVDQIKNFATLEQFQTTLQGLESIIQRMGNLILKYSRHGLSFQRELAEYNSLKRDFEQWTDQFRYGVGVETLKQVGELNQMMKDQKEFLTKYHNSIVELIRPPGMDRKRPIPACLDGTRERIFKKIDSFLAERSSPNILWIKGFPGSGKSCIARSLVDKLTNAGSFGASFFFERDNGGFTAPSTMARSLSSDLCTHPVFLDALIADSQVGTMNFSTTRIEDQFHRLVEKPLQSVANHHHDRDSLVVVLDALDECGGLPRSRSKDLQDALAAVKRWSELAPSLRFIITSRDETPISEVLCPISTPLDLKLSSHQATRDIEKFLTLELRRIGADHFLPDWPTLDEIRTVAIKAKGLFVWATTVVQFVDRPRPQDKLRQILEGCLPDHKFLGEFNAFVGAIVTADHSLATASPLFDIIGVEASTANYIHKQLRSVMVTDQKILRFNHQSFVDFLLSQTCPEVFRITLKPSRLNISIAILTFLHDHLQFNPCKLTSHRSNPKTQTAISAKLSFACQYWSVTLPMLQDEPGDRNILAALKTFFETKFLLWLEALSSISQTFQARDQLIAAKESIGTLDVHLSAFVEDAIAFVDAFQECISKSAPHIYLSAMAFTPESSKIYQTYSPRFLRYASLTFQTAEDLRRGRSAVLAPIVYVPSGDETADSLEGHVREVLSTIFIQNGHVASASYDGTIRFWNPDDGAPALTPFVPMPFANRSEPIVSLAFSEKAMLLVAGSRDGDASIWNMKSHDILASLPHRDAVTCVSLSPSGRVVITGCKNGTVTFWDIQSRQECRQAFHEHTERVTSVSFLEDDIAVSERAIYSLAGTAQPRGFVAACYSCLTIWNLSNDNVPSAPIHLAKNSRMIESIAAGVGLKIEIWDSQTGELVLGPLAGHTKPVTSVAFSDDGQRLVSGSIDRSVRVWNVGRGDGAHFHGFPDGAKMDSAGWIRGPKPKEKLILWVPETHRRRLCWGRTVAVMDGRPAAYLTVADSLTGKRWYKCLI
ncbi:hypothetical protein C8R45DRAFT_1185879 [Mycena sanguinolenta]|nr:hypothetical protein C8R45DRAFT_1185879 [Mycena sanguinolenta]